MKFISLLIHLCAFAIAISSDSQPELGTLTSHSTMSSEDVRRQELYDLNTIAWLDEENLKVPSKLDSSVKKNTAFIKRIKTSIHPDQVASVIKDLEGLSLNKYLSELVQAVYDTTSKITKSPEFLAANEIISALHQRFGASFSTSFILDVLIGLSNDYNVDDDTIKVNRQKTLLRLLMELTLIGVVRSIRDIDKLLIPDKILKKFNHKDHISELIILVVLKDLLQFDIENGPYLQMISGFIKRYYKLIETLLPGHFEKFTVVFRIYARLNLKILSKLSVSLNKTINQYNKSSLKYGKVFDDRDAELTALEKQFYYFHDNLKSLCELIDVEFPEFPIAIKDANTENHKTIEIVNVNENGTDEGLIIWESAQEEKFYTVLTPLEEIDPPNFDQVFSEYTSKTDGEKIGLFLDLFENIKDENEVENLVLIFNKLSLNNKATVNRMFRFFTESGYSLYYKFYTKFLKLNQANLQPLVDDVVEFLDLKLTSQLFRDKMSFKFIYFYIEFIKFKLIPSYKIFHKLRTLVVNIADTNNIDILIVFCEKAGRFLLYDVDYRELMLKIIALLKEHQKSPELRINSKLSIKHMLVTLELPTTSKAKPLQLSMPKLTDKQEFLVRLVKTELNSSNFKDVFKLVNQYNFNQDDYHWLIIDLFTNGKFINYSNLTNLIELLKHLSKPPKNNFILIEVVDQLIENIIRNIEANDYRTNRERILHAKLVCESYKQRLISFSLVIDLCYKILMTGHPNNQPLPMNYEVECDLPDNYFKIQIICILLSEPSRIFIPLAPNNTKGMNENINKANREIETKLHSFMTFFQYYIFCKEPTIPKEVQFQLDHVFENMATLMDLKVYENLMDSVGGLKAIMDARNKSKSTAQKPQVTKNGIELGEDEDENDDELLALGDDEEDFDPSDSDSDTDVDIEDESPDEADLKEFLDPEEEEEEVVSTENELMNSDRQVQDFTETEPEDHPKNSKAREFENDLERKFNKMILDSYGSANPGPNVANKAQTNISIPQTKGPIKQTSKFNLLLKNGKKSNLKEISFSDAKVTQRILAERRMRQRNKEKIMNLVMNMED